MLLLGTAALVVIVVAAVLVTRGGNGPSPTVERGDGAAFPLRGSLADDRGAIDAAIDAWKDGRGAGADSRFARMSKADIHVLYAGKAGERDVVIVRQGSRVIAMHNPLDRGWVVGAAREDFDAFDESPLAIDDAVLLPAGDWTYLPLRRGGSAPRTVDGLIGAGSAYGSLDDGLIVEGSAPPRTRLGKVFDPKAGLFGVDTANYRTIMDAARHPGRLTAIHAALVDDGLDEQPRSTHVRSLEVLWTGRVAGAREAAVVARDDPHRLGLGVVEDPDDLVSSAASVDLGSRLAPLGAHGRERPHEAYVGAAYVPPGGNEPTSLVAAATGKAKTIEFLVGDRRFSRPGPVAVVPVDWDAATTDAVVFGRTAGGEVIAPLAPESP
jgi:hypothetical protein